MFRVGSKDGDYVAFEIPSQSGASDPETYYWTNSNSTIGFVTEYDAKLATVFKIIPVQLWVLWIPWVAFYSLNYSFIYMFYLVDIIIFNSSLSVMYNCFCWKLLVTSMFHHAAESNVQWFCTVTHPIRNSLYTQAYTFDPKWPAHQVYIIVMSVHNIHYTT